MSMKRVLEFNPPPPKNATEIFEVNKKRVPKVWDSLRPLQRTKVFHMKPACLFVFHDWKELNKVQKQIVFDAVRILIENTIVNEEVGYFIQKLRSLL